MTIDTEIVDLRYLSSSVTNTTLPTVLTVAGSDSSGGAGIEADIKTITAHGCYALTCITALTAQNTTGVKAIYPTPKESINGILEANFSDINVNVVKTGLLTAEAAELLPKYLEKYHKGKPLVVDPVIVAASGDSLAKIEDLKISIDNLFRKATIITPNIEECGAIVSTLRNLSTIAPCNISTVEDLKVIAKTIQEGTKCVGVLVKGGHCPFDSEGISVKVSKKSPVSVFDVFYEGHTQNFTVFKANYIVTKSSHGTGCTLASAIAANLGRGLKMKFAVDSALKYVHSGILSADSTFGKGSIGPLNHIFHVAAPIAIASASRLPFTEGHFVDYLLGHPIVKPVYERYIHHDFVRRVADGSLERSKFEHYLQQDYAYLLSYARVHSLAASVAPELKDIEAEGRILLKVAEEMEHHRQQLENLGKDTSNIKMGRACQEYADYLLDLSKSGDWLEINVALAPCLLGYASAAKWGLQLYHGDMDPKDEYYKWLADYSSDWYEESCDLGRQVLESHGASISVTKLSKLVKIFADVTQLEVNFWSASLAYEGK
ncbi:unnamed protein product [Kuraishia capsulata CBS 1993]|uniref:Pyridoxamine kinase/Phosphomethylpyrimidine kinase domain-containing protein n=1 Tax=Kuraishia capsulata CBS 1993 TaxID=1382522 RepID=W6MT39_9ASCO|nr:uncharacterized protein KUCA_T00005520001 [Kuraishia capsulata CBS 1993]CDK29528.1 unnamed protein product [Kuraishia capsulata CBS 1993]